MPQARIVRIVTISTSRDGVQESRAGSVRDDQKIAAQLLTELHDTLTIRPSQLRGDRGDATDDHRHNRPSKVVDLPGDPFIGPHGLGIPLYRFQKRSRHLRVTQTGSR